MYFTTNRNKFYLQNPFYSDLQGRFFKISVYNFGKRIVCQNFVTNKFYADEYDE